MNSFTKHPPQLILPLLKMIFKLQLYLSKDWILGSLHWKIRYLLWLTNWMLFSLFFQILMPKRGRRQLLQNVHLILFRSRTKILMMMVIKIQLQMFQLILLFNNNNSLKFLVLHNMKSLMMLLELSIRLLLIFLRLVMLQSLV